MNTPVTSRFLQFKDLIDRYDSFILDIWGVIHDGVRAYPGAIDCVNTLVEMKKNIIFLSNAPRPGKILMKKLHELGIVETGTSILSSGDMVRAELEALSHPSHPNHPIFQKSPNKRCYHLGAARNQDILADIKLDCTDDIQNAGFILLTAYADEGEDINQYAGIFAQALRLNLPLICANPDTEIMNGEKLRYCAGVFAEQYEKLGGKVFYYGKPYPQVYQRILEKLQQDSPTFNEGRILVVGDTLETDILGAKQVGIQSAITKTGNIARMLAKNTGWVLSEMALSERALSEEEKLQQLFTRANLWPDWIIPGFYL